MNLEDSFKQFIQLNFNHALTQKVLLTISGGPDSVALLHLYNNVSKNITVAHCNFGLRGIESDQDEAFVKDLCNKKGIECFTIKFNTKEFASQNALSIQMAARELRYNWFEQLSIEHHFNFIATAHHLDDNVETVLINLIRGTGIKGLSGIPVSNGKIIRPLLFATKQQLLDYLNQHTFSYRVDASNKENKYIRNKLRNDILPQLALINPEVNAHINDLSIHSKFTAQIVANKIEELKQLHFFYNEDVVIISYLPVSGLDYAPLYLFEFISSFGFNTTQCSNIHQSFLSQKTGSQFFSETHELIIDRANLIITPLSNISNVVIEHKLEFGPSQIFKLSGKNFGADIISAKSISNYLPGHLYLNADNLSFPLTIRNWKAGDKLHPLGSGGKKKVSDYLTDRKISIADKRNIFVLENKEGKIIAIINHIIDDEFKVLTNSKMVVHIYEK
jgi:tRNA(Ile)-lysidine synthase